MDAIGAPTMPPKKKRVGRPKAPQPLRSLISLKGTEDLEAWIEGLVKKARVGTRAQALRNALEAYAADCGYDAPMPER